VRGIIATGTHPPHRRLDRAAVAAFFGKGGGTGTRTVASFDEDTTTMGAEAARAAVASATGVDVDALWFATASPAYLEKTNASAIHATLRLDASVPAFDFGGAHRSGTGALRTALEAGPTTLVVASDSRDGLATSADESQGGDGAAALLIGDDTAGPVLAEFVGGASVTDEFLERWRVPGGDRSRTWEERFGEVVYAPLMEQAWTAALADTGLVADDIHTLVVVGTHARAVARNVGKLGVAAERIGNDLSESVGNTGTAHPLLVLAAAIETAGPGEAIAIMALADGVDVINKTNPKQKLVIKTSKKNRKTKKEK
jgi:3-hydroxy-3-methylglutaryl CoA synthase